VTLNNLKITHNTLDIWSVSSSILLNTNASPEETGIQSGIIVEDLKPG
jgi:hypothetical protein